MKKLNSKILLLLKSLFVFLFLGSAASTLAAPLALDGSWQTDVCNPCDVDLMYPTTWEWTSTEAVQFDITDYFVIGESYAVYDFGTLVFTTPDLPSYSELGVGGTDSGYWTADPDVSFASALWSSESHIFGAGSHSISIKNLEYVAPYADHWVAVRASAVPEPAAIILLVIGLVCLIISRRRNNVEQQNLSI